MSRGRSKVLLIIPLVAAVGGLVTVARLMVRPARDRSEGRSEGAVGDEASRSGPQASGQSEAQALGRAKLHITVPSDSGLTSVSYAVVSPEHIVVARGTAPIDKQSGLAAPAPLGLPGGKAYTLAVVGNSQVGSIKRASYLGSDTFELPSGNETQVTFSPNAGAGPGATVSAGASTAAGATPPNDATTACQSCELSSDQGVCASENITATSNTDPNTGDQTGIGWGCGTLADSKARSACLALLHCLNVNGCGHPGENPVAGCYCGTAAAEACIGGQGINGACIAEYQAAAVVSPGGPAAGAGTGQLSQFITTASSDPTTPVGLANNVKHCASETHCEACQTL